MNRHVITRQRTRHIFTLRVYSSSPTAIIDMPAWGSDAFKSCDSLIQRIEANDPTLTDLVILPTKTFGDNEVERLIAVIQSGSNTFWKSLTASGHLVSPQVLSKLGKALAGSPRTDLVELSIGDNSMGDEGVIALCKGLTSDNPLRKLDISYKSLTGAGFRCVVEILGQSENLHSLNLSRNPELGLAYVPVIEKVPEEAMETLPHALKNLVELDLAECSIDATFCTSFLASFQPTEPVAMRLDNNPLGATFSLATVLSKCHKLQVSNCELADSTLKTLKESNVIVACRILDLSKNRLTSVGAADLGICLCTSLCDLCELNLEGNNLGEQGVVELVRALEQRERSLSLLDLSSTKCGIAGAVAAVDKGRCSSLRLYNNKLGSEGIQALAQCLHNRIIRLEYLDVAGNGADSAAVVELLRSLLAGGTPQLKTLILEGNENNEDVEAIAIQLKQTRPSLDIARDKLKRNQPQGGMGWP
jgi:Ran GTPase-activating protein (RanGAP) involved in mRNA processing and transport